MNIKPEGPCCPVSSPLQDMRIPWVPSDETDISKTFARELAKMRSPYYESSYDEVERDNHLMFANGFKS